MWLVIGGRSFALGSFFILMTNYNATSPALAPLLVIIPAWNEEETVASVVSEARRACGCDVVVIDDASTDDTVARARGAGAIVLPLRLQLKSWGATQAGLRYALKYGYRTVITMDADGQHEAASLPALLEPLGDGRADVVIGAYPERGSRARKITWTFFRKFTGLSHEDLTSGLRAYNREAITVLAAHAATLLEYQDLGVLLLLRRAGLRIKEVPVTMNLRETGKSRIFHSWFQVFFYLLHTGILCLAKIGRSARCEKLVSPPAPPRRG